MGGYPRHLVDHILSEVKFTERESTLQQRQETQNKPLPFVTQYYPSVPHLKRIFMGKWHWIENQPLLREIYKEPPFISYRKVEILKRYTCESKTLRVKVQHHHEKWELCLHGLSTFFQSLNYTLFIKMNIYLQKKLLKRFKRFSND